MPKRKSQTGGSRSGPRSRSRRDEYADQTRAALLDAAEALFGTRGYAATSLDQICDAARVTKGALYHHFDGKLALFEATFVRVIAHLMGYVFSAMAAPDDPFERATAGLAAWLDAVAGHPPALRVLPDAPVALGFERWRVLRDETTGSVITDSIQSLIDSGQLKPVPVEELSGVLFGAIVEGAILISHADDPAAKSEKVKEALLRILEGLRA